MIGALITLLSLAMTNTLVGDGLIAQTFNVSAATTATPIVVTTSAPHQVPSGRVLHAVVSGLGGMPEASGTWVLTPTGTSTFALTTFSDQGAVINSVGTGTYTSGGTIQTAFPDGAILLGRRNVAMMSARATPRIVFVPLGSPEWSLEPYGGVIPSTLMPRSKATQTAEQLTMKQSRQLATERQRFEVFVTAKAATVSPDFGDFDAVQALYQTLYGVMFDTISPDRARVLKGEWRSQNEGEASLGTGGEQWVGIIEIHQPVIDNPLAFVPHGTVGTIVVNFAGGASGDQTVIVVT